MAEPGGPIPPRPAHLPGQPRTNGAPRPIATVPGRPAAGRPQGSRPAGRSNRENVRGGRRNVRLAALAGAALSTMAIAVVGLSGAVGLGLAAAGTGDPAQHATSAARATPSST